MKKQLVPLFVCFYFPATLLASSAADILGMWWTKENKAKVEITKCGAGYCGKLAWLKDPVYKSGVRVGWEGKEKVDYRNPDSSKHNDPILGLQIVSNLKYVDGIWKDGTVYDPENGKTYSCKAKIEVGDVLALRGFIGFSLFGRTSEWRRVK